MTAKLTWSWPDARLATLSVLPAFWIIAVGNVKAGVACAVGILPVGLMGLAKVRTGRRQALIVGYVFALSILIGPLLRENSVLTIIGMFVLPLLAALLAARVTAGQLMLAIVVPALSIGLAFGSVPEAAGLSLMIAAGTSWSVFASLLWRGQSKPKKQSPARMNIHQARQYGILLGATAATAVSIGLIFDFQHLGWAPTAALLVMRPVKEMLERRAIGRVLAVLIGALVALLVVRLELLVGWLALLICLVAVATIATKNSYWYITAGGTTFMVLNLMLYGAQDTAIIQQTFWARVGENALGIGLAYFYGVVIAKSIENHRRL